MGEIGVGWCFLVGGDIYTTMGGGPQTKGLVFV